MALHCSLHCSWLEDSQTDSAQKLVSDSWDKVAKMACEQRGKALLSGQGMSESVTLQKKFSLFKGAGWTKESFGCKEKCFQTSEKPGQSSPFELLKRPCASSRQIREKSLAWEDLEASSTKIGLGLPWGTSQRAVPFCHPSTPGTQSMFHIFLTFLLFF